MIYSVFNTKPPSFSIKEAMDVIQHHFNFQTYYNLDELYSDRDQNFFFKDTSKKYILKIFNHAEDLSTINLQLDAIKYISKKNINILLPNPKSDIIEIFKDGKKFRSVVYEYIDGYFYSDKQLTDQNYNELGKFIGEISTALIGFQNSGSKRNFEWDIQNINFIYDRIKYIDLQSNQNIICYFLNEYEKNVVPYLDNLRMSVIHNDCNDHNILINKHKKSLGLIDFGDMIYSFQVLEPAVCMAYLSLKAKNIKSAFFSFLQGYRSCFPLQENELKCIMYIVCFRLCISVSMSAWRKSLFPDNKYLTISEKSAWMTLEYFKNENLNEWTSHLLNSYAKKE
tara:strand:- start:3977 stop:4993 length:1017 start_codon:yes stop_codon:yes gene_type:complete